MIYIKKHIATDMKVKIDVYEDEFYAKCPNCKTEFNLDTEMLIAVLKNCDFAGTQVFCEECSEKKLEKGGFLMNITQAVEVLKTMLGEDDKEDEALDVAIMVMEKFEQDWCS